MKLKKLLLPIASVASTAAIVAPIVTSCGGKTLKWEFELTNDGITAYEAKYEPIVNTAAGNLNQVNNLYFGELNKNKDIFADDILKSLSVLWQDDSWWNYDKLNGTVSMQINKFDFETKRISYKLVNDFEYVTSDDYEGKCKSTIEVKNLKMEVVDWYNVTSLSTEYYVAAAGLTGEQIVTYYNSPLEVYPLALEAALEADKEWSIHWTIDREIASQTHKHTINWTYKNVTSEFTGYNWSEGLVVNDNPDAAEVICAWGYYGGLPYHLSKAA